MNPGAAFRIDRMIREGYHVSRRYDEGFAKILRLTGGKILTASVRRYPGGESYSTR